MSTTNIAQDNAGVGQVIGGRPAGVEAYAWVTDALEDVWLLAGLDAATGQGVYARHRGTELYRLLRIDDLYGIEARGPLVYVAG